MKIILFSRAQIAHTPEEIRQLIGTIGAFGFDYAVNEEFAPLVEQATGTALPPERIYGRYIGNSLPKPSWSATEATERCSKGCTVSAARRFP